MGIALGNQTFVGIAFGTYAYYLIGNFLKLSSLGTNIKLLDRVTSSLQPFVVGLSLVTTYVRLGTALSTYFESSLHSVMQQPLN